MNTVKINVVQISQTDLAILVSDGHRQAWVPLSQIEEQIQEPRGELGLLTTTAIVVPDWVAREKGLQQRNQDKETTDMFGDQA